MNSTITIFHHTNDNQDLASGEQAWVSLFSDYFTSMLGQMVNGEVQIQLVNQNNQDDQVFSTSDILIVVISSDLIRSTQAMSRLAEIGEFYGLGAAGNLDPTKKVYKVLKEFARQEEQPLLIKKILPYKFYTQDQNSFDYFRNSKDFWLNLADLCYDVVEAKKYHDELEKGVGPKTVYLAEVGDDLIAERLKVKRELQQFGYKVLPEKSYHAENLELLEQEILDDLYKCAISIHLFGSEYGDLIPENQLSFTEFQNKVAASYSKERFEGSNHKLSFPRFIWLSPQAIYRDERQKFFIDRLKRDANWQYGAEIIQVKFEDFKTTVLSQLAGFVDHLINDLQHLKKKGEGKEQKAVYLVSDKRDINASKTVRKALEDNDAYVLQIGQDVDSRKSRSLHHQYLLSCESVLILYETARKEWLFSKIQDLIKAPGLGREKPFKTKTLMIPSGMYQELSTELSKWDVASLEVITYESVFNNLAVQKFLAMAI